MRTLKMLMLLLLGFWNSEMSLAQKTPDNPEQQIQEVLKTVKLDQEQRLNVRQIRESSRSRLQTLRDELDKRRSEMNRLLDKDADDEAVRQAFQQMQNTKMALEKARFERMLSIRKVLSEEQRTALRHLRQKARAANRAPGSPETRRE